MSKDFALNKISLTSSDKEKTVDRYNCIAYNLFHGSCSQGDFEPDAAT
jgi:hypothetical protein